MWPIEAPAQRPWRPEGNPVACCWCPSAGHPGWLTMKMAIQNWWLNPKCGRNRCLRHHQGRRKQANWTIASISDATMYSLRLYTAMAITACPVMSYAASLGPDEAASHIGENATVCGMVASATYAAQAMAAPTFWTSASHTRIKSSQRSSLEATERNLERQRFRCGKRKFASREKYFSSKRSQR
jgi:hypothetical protein